MSLRTVEQVRRAFRIIVGFTLLLVGVVMLVTPGPGWLVIFLGLGLLLGSVIFPLGVLLQTITHGPLPRAIAIAGSAFAIAGLLGSAVGVAIRGPSNASLG